MQHSLFVGLKVINSNLLQFYGNYGGREISECCKVIRPVSDTRMSVNSIEIYLCVTVSESVVENCSFKLILRALGQAVAHPCNDHLR